MNITISDQAAELVKNTMAEIETEDPHLFIYVAGGGCSGLQYGLAVSEGEPEIDDYIVFDKDIKIVVDGNSAKYLNGTILFSDISTSTTDDLAYIDIYSYFEFVTNTNNAKFVITRLTARTYTTFPKDTIGFDVSTINFTATNSTSAPLVATIVVTPTFTNGPSICTGSPKTYTITVNPTGQVTQPVNQVVCNSVATTAITFATTNTLGTTTYAWTNSNTTIGLAGSGTGNIASFVAVNTTTAPIVATIVVTPTFTNGSKSCAGPTKTFTITVNPIHKSVYRFLVKP